MMKRIYMIMLWQILPLALLAQTYQYYGGNLHAHTAYSDGNKDREETGVTTPAESYAFAKQSKQFHFLGISEHNHSGAGMELANYSKGLKQADDASSDDFACLYGMEYGVIKNGGHVLIFGIDELIGWETDNADIPCPQYDYDALWDLLVDYPNAFATLAHPETSDFGDLLNGAYNKNADKAICGVAVMTGPAFAENTDYDSEPAKKFTNYFRGLLAAGYHVGPTVDHDNHNLTFGRMASSRTIVLAKKLDRKSIVDAYKEMRFYASTDWNIKVTFTINGLPMGKRINTKTDAVIKVTVKDEDAGDKVASIKIMYGEPGNGEMSTQLTKSAGNSLSYTYVQDKGSEYYYYVEITQEDGDKVYTSPIWVRRLK